MAAVIHVEVAYAGCTGQTVLQLELQAGASAAQAAEASGLLERYPEIDWPTDRIGIFGRKVAAQTRLRDGDRVELYRPLRLDPKERRRQQARRTKG